MNRLITSASILFLLLLFSLSTVFAGAAAKPTKSLHQATIDGDIEQVQLNISAGADVNAKDNMGYTPLLYAAKDGKEEVAELLIAGGADVNVKDQLGNTPLHYAAVSGHYDVCRLLLDEDADANAKNLMGGTPLAMAQAGNHDKIVELLSSNVDNQIGTKPAEVSKEAELLHQAVMVGDVNQVKSLISKGVDVNAKNRLGWTALHNALWYGYKAVAELLIDKGSDVNAKEPSGKTPLHFLAVKGGREAAELLIAKGANVNATDATRQTSLLLAASYGHKDLVELLIEKGADVNAQSGSDNALSMARKKNYEEIEQLLLKHGAKEPTIDLMEDRLYGPESESEALGLYPGRGMQAERGSSRAISSHAMLDVLADPNEIKARIKTFEGLEKALEELNSKSRLEKAAWLQRRYDNRTSLFRAVKEQFKQELTFIRKIADQEKAEKTTKTIDDVLSGREKLDSEIYKELLAQKRDMKLAESLRGRGRGGYQSRSTRGRYPQGRTLRGPQPGEDMAGPYAERGRITPRMDDLADEGYVPQEVETENKIREWLQTTPDNKANLLRSVHTEIQTEYISIREAAVEEGAKKTTAAIDGILLSRGERFDELTMRMEGERMGLPGQLDRYLPGQRYPQDRRMGEQIPGEHLRGQELNYLEQENRRLRR